MPNQRGSVMSLKYEILKKAAKLVGLKRRGMKSSEEIIAIKKKENAGITVPDLKDDDFDFEKIDVNGHCVLAMKHKNKKKKVCLFVIGGGMVSAPKPNQIRKGLRFGKETDMDVYIPYYPLCTEYPVNASFEMLHETYRKMLEGYKPEDISFLGTSSGGYLVLGLIAYMNDIGSDLPFPHHIMAISPGTCPFDEDEKKRMYELDKKDVAISAEYMMTAEEIMKHGRDDLSDYMIHLQNGDFSNCPEVTFIYGSNEVLYAIAPSFEKAMKRYGVHYDMIVGEGLFHCYPVFPICKEGKEGWEMMIRIMKEKA